MMAGRGFGKTRAGAEWVRMIAESGSAGSIALVGDTADDVRQVMVEGPSGILAVAPSSHRPAWHRSTRRLDWPNGVVARCYSAADPEQLRGLEFDHGWADEIGEWPDPAAWDNLMLALQRNWRPITRLSFLGLVVADAFGMLAFRLADQAWLLLQIGLGGYVVGRSVEKISPQIAASGHNGHGQSGNAHKVTPAQKPRPKQPAGPATRVPARKK